MTGTESRAVSWWPTHVFITALVAQADTLPAAGTPSWCALDDADPRKLLALAVAGEHWVLRTETAQESRASASKAVAASTDWAKVARELHSLASWRASRPWAQRVVSHD